MTPRDHYNYIYPIIMELDFNDFYTTILECESFEEATPLFKNLHKVLIEEIEKDRGDGNFYKPFSKKQQFKEYRMWEHFSEIIELDDNLLCTEKLDRLKAMSSMIYDSIIVEKIRTYAYEVYLKGGINNYVQLASDIQDCYLEDLKDDGLFDEFEGAKYADIPDYIGDGKKFVGAKDDGLDLDPNEEYRKHLENIVRDDDFQELLDDMLDALMSDDIEYVKGMLVAQHNDNFKILAENYCYKNGLPIEMADKIAWEFEKQEIKAEDDGLDELGIKLNWVRDELDEE